MNTNNLSEAFNYEERRKIRQDLETRQSQLINSEDWKEAIKIQSILIAMYPTFWRDYSDRGELHMADGNMEAAIDDFTKAIELHSRSYTYENRAKAYAKIGQIDHAMRDIHEGMRIQEQEYQQGVYISKPRPLRF